MTQHQSLKEKTTGLEVIRGIAATVVVICHVYLFKLIPQDSALGGLALIGQFATEAVMIFFVLSGFVITLACEKNGYLDGADSALQDRFARLYVRARLLRICPIFFIALAITNLATYLSASHWMPATQLLGNFLFLQSLPGYIVSAPMYNSALWSLSYEMFFYLLFSVVILKPRFAVAWTVLAVIAGAALYPPPAESGARSHFISLLSFSTIWLMGFWAAKLRLRIEPVPLATGLAYFSIGLILSRCSFSAGYYDLARLSLFALFCCPLVISVAQRHFTETRKNRRWTRIAVLGIATYLLWTMSNSALSTKLALSALAWAINLLPTGWLTKMVRALAVSKPLWLYLGSISYAIYAIHLPLIFILKSAFANSHWLLGGAGFLFLSISLAHLLEMKLQPRLVACFRDGTVRPPSPAS